VYAAIRRRLPAAVFAVTCSAFAVTSAATCQAADDSSPVPSQTKQALDTATQLEGFLKQLEKKRMRTPRDRREAVKTFDQLSNLWDRVWKDLNDLCSKEALELDLWNLQGQSRLPRDDD